MTVSKISHTAQALLFAFALLGVPEIGLGAPVTVYKDYVFQEPPAVVLNDLPRKNGCNPGTATNDTRILVFGDSGTGDENQKKVAAAMQKFCEKNGCDLALMMGDNIHPTGVKSVEDPQFIAKFEKPYAGLCIPFYTMLGEHDWGRKGEMSNWRAQIEYTQRSTRWRLPSDVYSLTIGDLKILALNTNTLDTSPEQAAWLKKELENSKAGWNLVMGHKPINSYGYHGDTDFMVAQLLPQLCGRADLYLSAHEHNLQVLKADCGLPLLVAGSGGKLRTENATGPRSLFGAPGLGFMYLQVQEQAIQAQVVTATGDILYSFTIPQRNKPGPADVNK